MKRNMKGSGNGKLALVPRLPLFSLNQSRDPKELLFSGSERQEQMNKPFLRLPNHSLALYYLHPLARKGRKKEDFQSRHPKSTECQVTAPSPSHKLLMSS